MAFGISGKVEKGYGAFGANGGSADGVWEPIDMEIVSVSAEDFQRMANNPELWKEFKEKGKIEQGTEEENEMPPAWIHPSHQIFHDNVDEWVKGNGITMNENGRIVSADRPINVSYLLSQVREVDDVGEKFLLDVSTATDFHVKNFEVDKSIQYSPAVIPIFHSQPSEEGKYVSYVFNTITHGGIRIYGSNTSIDIGNTVIFPAHWYDALHVVAGQSQELSKRGKKLIYIEINEVPSKFFVGGLVESRELIVNDIVALAQRHDVILVPTGSYAEHNISRIKFMVDQNLKSLYADRKDKTPTIYFARTWNERDAQAHGFFGMSSWREMRKQERVAKATQEQMQRNREGVGGDNWPLVGLPILNPDGTVLGADTGKGPFRQE